jgi:hypothetical protein
LHTCADCAAGNQQYYASLSNTLDLVRQAVCADLNTAGVVLCNLNIINVCCTYLSLCVWRFSRPLVFVCFFLILDTTRPFHSSSDASYKGTQNVCEQFAAAVYRGGKQLVFNIVLAFLARNVVAKLRNPRAPRRVFIEGRAMAGVLLGVGKNITTSLCRQAAGSGPFDTLLPALHQSCELTFEVLVAAHCGAFKGRCACLFSFLVADVHFVLVLR